MYENSNTYKKKLLVWNVIFSINVFNYRAQKKNTDNYNNL